MSEALGEPFRAASIPLRSSLGLGSPTRRLLPRVGAARCSWDVPLPAGGRELEPTLCLRDA